MECCSKDSKAMKTSEMKDCDEAKDERHHHDDERPDTDFNFFRS